MNAEKIIGIKKKTIIVVAVGVIIKKFLINGKKRNVVAVAKKYLNLNVVVIAIIKIGNLINTVSIKNTGSVLHYVHIVALKGNK